MVEKNKLDFDNETWNKIKKIDMRDMNLKLMQNSTLDSTLKNPIIKLVIALANPIKHLFTETSNSIEDMILENEDLLKDAIIMNNDERYLRNLIIYISGITSGAIPEDTIKAFVDAFDKKETWAVKSLQKLVDALKIIDESKKVIIITTISLHFMSKQITVKECNEYIRITNDMYIDDYMTLKGYRQSNLNKESSKTIQKTGDINVETAFSGGNTLTTSDFSEEYRLLSHGILQITDIARNSPAFELTFFGKKYCDIIETTPFFDSVDFYHEYINKLVLQNRNSYID